MNHYNGLVNQPSISAYEQLQNRFIQVVQPNTAIFVEPKPQAESLNVKKLRNFVCNPYSGCWYLDVTMSHSNELYAKFEISPPNPPPSFGQPIHFFESFAGSLELGYYANSDEFSEFCRSIIDSNELEKYQRIQVIPPLYSNGRSLEYQLLVSTDDPSKAEFVFVKESLTPLYGYRQSRGQSRLEFFAFSKSALEKIQTLKQFDQKVEPLDQKVEPRRIFEEAQIFQPYWAMLRYYATNYLPSLQQNIFTSNDLAENINKFGKLTEALLREVYHAYLRKEYPRHLEIGKFSGEFNKASKEILSESDSSSNKRNNSQTSRSKSSENIIAGEIKKLNDSVVQLTSVFKDPSGINPPKENVPVFPEYVNKNLYTLRDLRNQASHANQYTLQYLDVMKAAFYYFSILEWWDYTKKETSWDEKQKELLNQAQVNAKKSYFEIREELDLTPSPKFILLPRFTPQYPTPY